MSITADDLDLLRHALGAEPERSRKSWGFRNYFCAGGPDAGWERLVAAGFARNCGAHGAGDIYYAATRDGCRAVGMTDREIARMEPQPVEAQRATPAKEE